MEANVFTVKMLNDVISSDAHPVKTDVTTKMEVYFKMMMGCHFTILVKPVPPPANATESTPTNALDLLMKMRRRKILPKPRYIYLKHKIKLFYLFKTSTKSV